MRQLSIGVACVIASWCGHVSAEDFYVATDGADSNAGTMAEPFATVERAEQAAAPGDTVYIRGGEYHFSGTQKAVGVRFSKSGAQGKPLQYFAAPGEAPIFDLFELKPQQRVTGLDVQANWVHIRGLEVRGVRQLIVGDSWGVRVRGDHNIIEQLNVHDCEAPGIFIASGTSNLILNSDSHDNYDPLEDGGNADGFGCHSSGGDNVLRGCRAWENSDDGYDFINAAGSCIVEGSWSFRNGYIPGTNMPGQNGAGFKSGGYGMPPKTPATGPAHHTVRNCVAFANRAIGFYANYHPGGIDFFDNTAFNNPANYDMRTPGADQPSSHKLRNNVALEPGRTIINFNGGTDDFNSWTLPVQVSNADFASVDIAQAMMPRSADGSLPSMTFARLQDGSDLIDKGEDVGLPFTGKAPDLGAYEWGAPTTSPEPDAGVPDAGAAATAGKGAAGTGGVGGAPSAAGAAGTQPTTAAAGRPATQPSAGMTAATVGSATASAGGAPAAAGSAATTSAPPAASHSDSGCNCRVAQSHRKQHNLVYLAVFALTVASRARKRVRRGAERAP